MSLRIFIEFDGDNFVLMCDDGRMAAVPCGARILRGPPHPDVAFIHATAEGAEADARKLRAYLAALPAAKHSKKRTAESAA